MNISTNVERYPQVGGTPPVLHLRVRVHGSVFFETPSLVAYVGILAWRFKAADLAFIATTLQAIDTAEEYLKRTAVDKAVVPGIEEDFRLIFQMFEGPKLLQIPRVGYMGSGDLKFDHLSSGEAFGDRDAIEAAVSLRDKYIVTSRPQTLMPAHQWLHSHNIHLKTIRELAYDLRDLSREVYRDALAEHRSGMEFTSDEHRRWLLSHRLPTA